MIVKISEEKIENEKNLVAELFQEGRRRCGHGKLEVEWHADEITSAEICDIIDHDRIRAIYKPTITVFEVKQSP